MGSTQSTWGLFSEFSSCVHHEVCPCICQPFGFVCRRFHSPVQEAGPAQEPNHLKLCTDIITDLDDFITSDTTEAEIVAFVEQLCSAIGALIPGLEATCNAFVEANLPSIIDGIAEQNLDPTTICTMLTMCP